MSGLINALELLDRGTEQAFKAVGIILHPSVDHAGIAALFTLIASGTILYRAVTGDPIFAQAAAAPVTAEALYPQEAGWDGLDD